MRYSLVAAVFAVVVGVVCGDGSSGRKVTVEACATGVCSDNIAQANARGPSDDLVFLWSTLGAPAIAMARCIGVRVGGGVGMRMYAAADTVLLVCVQKGAACTASFDRTKLTAFAEGGASFTGTNLTTAQAFVVSAVVEFDDADKSSVYGNECCFLLLSVGCVRACSSLACTLQPHPRCFRPIHSTLRNGALSISQTQASSPWRRARCLKGTLPLLCEYRCDSYLLVCCRD